MSRYTAKELKWLAKVAAEADANHFADMVLWEEHRAAQAYAEETGKPVQGVCPTMFRDPSGPPIPLGFNTTDLVSKLLEDAEKLRQGKGPYRSLPTETELLDSITADIFDTERRERFERWRNEDRTLAGLLREGLLDIS